MENTNLVEELRGQVARLETLREAIWQYRRAAPDNLAIAKRMAWRARWMGLFGLSVAILSATQYDAAAPWAFIQGVMFALNFGVFLWNIVPAESNLSAIKSVFSESANDLAECEKNLASAREQLQTLDKR